MVKKLTTAFSLVLSIAAMSPAQAQKKGTSGVTASRPALKFLDAIEVNSVSDPVAPISTYSNPSPELIIEPIYKEESVSIESNSIESAVPVQWKYALLLDTEVEYIQNLALFSTIDEWYGTRYVLGGSSKDGIDCSAFIQVLYAKLFQMPMPRTAKEQHKMAQSILKNELKEGDLVFFHTRGSDVSHVGMYLQNDKFVHAATSGGVMVSDLTEAYWAKKFLGAGRIVKSTTPEVLTVKP